MIETKNSAILLPEERELNEKFKKYGYHISDPELLTAAYLALNYYSSIVNGIEVPEDRLSPFNVLLEGEPGVGKTKFAKVFHKILEETLGEEVEFIVYACNLETNIAHLLKDVDLDNIIDAQAGVFKGATEVLGDITTFYLSKDKSIYVLKHKDGATLLHGKDTSIDLGNDYDIKNLIRDKEAGAYQNGTLLRTIEGAQSGKYVFTLIDETDKTYKGGENPLLPYMQEALVTLGGKEYRVEEENWKYMFTMYGKNYERPLSEAFLRRPFTMKLGYMSAETLGEIIDDKNSVDNPFPQPMVDFIIQVYEKSVELQRHSITITKKDDYEQDCETSPSLVLVPTVQQIINALQDDRITNNKSESANMQDQEGITDKRLARAFAWLFPIEQDVAIAKDLIKQELGIDMDKVVANLGTIHNSKISKEKDINKAIFEFGELKKMADSFKKDGKMKTISAFAEFRIKPEFKAGILKQPKSSLELLRNPNAENNIRREILATSANNFIAAAADEYTGNVTLYSAHEVVDPKLLADALEGLENFLKRSTSKNFSKQINAREISECFEVKAMDLQMISMFQTTDIEDAWGWKYQTRDGAVTLKSGGLYGVLSDNRDYSVVNYRTDKSAQTIAEVRNELIKVNPELQLSYAPVEIAVSNGFSKPDRTNIGKYHENGHCPEQDMFVSYAKAVLRNTSNNYDIVTNEVANAFDYNSNEYHGIDKQSITMRVNSIPEVESYLNSLSQAASELNKIAHNYILQNVR